VRDRRNDAYDRGTRAGYAVLSGILIIRASGGEEAINSCYSGCVGVTSRGLRWNACATR
jgi:hypothetical protein